MIVYVVNKSRHRFGAALLLCALLLCALLLGRLWWMSWDAPEHTAAANAPGPNHQADDSPDLVTTSITNAAGMSSPLRLLADGRPSEITPDDWLALNHALANLPRAQSSATRIVDYLAYQQDFERWQSLDGPQTETLRQQMAQALLAQLPGRLERGDFTPAEATMMGTALIAEIEPDDRARRQRIEAWNSQILNRSTPAGNDRLTLLQRRQSEVFSDWQISAAARRDNARLDKGMLDAQRWYDSGAPQ